MTGIVEVLAASGQCDEFPGGAHRKEVLLVPAESTEQELSSSSSPSTGSLQEDGYTTASSAVTSECACLARTTGRPGAAVPRSAPLPGRRLHAPLAARLGRRLRRGAPESLLALGHQRAAHDQLGPRHAVQRASGPRVVGADRAAPAPAPGAARAPQAPRASVRPALPRVIQCRTERAQGRGHSGDGTECIAIKGKCRISGNM